MRAVVFLAWLSIAGAVLHKNPKRRGKKTTSAMESPLTRNPADSGLHFVRYWSLNKDYATAKFDVVSDKKKCTSKDKLGDVSCSFKWGDSAHVVAQFERTKDLEQGTQFELELELKPLGLAAMYQIEPVHMKCPVCGDKCTMSVPKLNGLQVMPTKDDLMKIPMMGEVLLQMAAQKGITIPQNRSQLQTLVNTISRFAISSSPETAAFFPADAFTASNPIELTEKEMKFPTLACPIKPGFLPSFQTPPMPQGMPRFSLKMEQHSIDLESDLPENFAGFDPNLIELTGYMALKVTDPSGAEVTTFSGEFGVNRPVQSSKDLQMRLSSSKI